MRPWSQRSGAAVTAARTVQSQVPTRGVQSRAGGKQSRPLVSCAAGVVRRPPRLSRHVRRRGRVRQRGAPRRLPVQGWAVLGIEPRTSRTRSENHATRPNSQWVRVLAQSQWKEVSQKRRAKRITRGESQALVCGTQRLDRSTPRFARCHFVGSICGPAFVGGPHVSFGFRPVPHWRRAVLSASTRCCNTVVASISCITVTNPSQVGARAAERATLERI